MQKNILYKSTLILLLLTILPEMSFSIEKVKNIVISYTSLGREAGRIAAGMLVGKKQDQITINESSFYQHIFNWQELKRWNLLGSKLIPPDSIYYYKNRSFLDRYKWYLIGLLVFLSSQTTLILYLFRLNRRQKILNQQIHETQKMHQELIRMDRMAKMSELTASLSHELNQPLTAILYSAQAGNRFLLSGNLSSAQAKEIFDNIIEDDKRAGVIISSVRSLMKLETREYEYVNIKALIQETLEILHSEIIRQNIEIIYKFDARRITVFGDSIQLQQVLLNIIRNASNAMDKNDPEDKTLEIDMNVEGDSVIVSFLDSGPGIDASILADIFKPFVTTRKDGFGIGLALCKSIIEKHYGFLWAENIPGSGAQFSMKLRIAKNE